MPFNVEGTPLGFLDAQCWAGDPKENGKSKARKKWQIKDLASMKWLNSFSRVAAIQAQHPETRLVSLGDRESDVHNLFRARRGPRYRIP